MKSVMNKKRTGYVAAAIALTFAVQGRAQEAVRPPSSPPRPVLLSPEFPSAPEGDPGQGQTPDPSSSSPFAQEQVPDPGPPNVAPPALDRVPPSSTATAVTNPSSLSDPARSLSSLGIEGPGLGLGEGLPALSRVGYTETWYPDEPVGGAKGHDLEIVRQDLEISAPIYKEGGDVVSLSAGVRNEIVDTNARVPILGLPFPDELWNVHLGAGYQHRLDNGWTAGLNLRTGSASDDPFGNVNQITLGATGTLRIPVRERDALIFTLSYSNNIDFANNIPIPGIEYLWWPIDSFRVLVGIPFAQIWYRPVDKLTIDLSYRFLYTVQGRVTYHFLPGSKLYGGYSMSNESYFLVEAPQDDNRLFYSEQRVYAGLGWSLHNRLFVDLTSGLAFDRFYSEGLTFRSNQSLQLPVGAGPFVALAAQWRF